MDRRKRGGLRKSLLDERRRARWIRRSPSRFARARARGARHASRRRVLSEETSCTSRDRPRTRSPSRAIWNHNRPRAASWDSRAAAGGRVRVFARERRVAAVARVARAGRDARRGDRARRGRIRRTRALRAGGPGGPNVIEGRRLAPGARLVRVVGVFETSESLFAGVLVAAPQLSVASRRRFGGCTRACRRPAAAAPSSTIVGALASSATTADLAPRHSPPLPGRPWWYPPR